MSLNTDVDEAIRTIDQLIEDLWVIREARVYTVKEMKRIRKELLRVVRNNIDPYALGHAPAKRHY